MKSFFGDSFRCFLCLCVSCWVAQLLVIGCTILWHTNISVAAIHICACLIYWLVCTGALFLFAFRRGYLQDAAPMLQTLCTTMLALLCMLTLAILLNYIEFFSGGARDLAWLIAEFSGKHYVDLESIPNAEILGAMFLYSALYLPVPWLGRLCGRTFNHAKSRRFLRKQGK